MLLVGCKRVDGLYQEEWEKVEEIKYLDQELIWLPEGSTREQESPLVKKRDEAQAEILLQVQANMLLRILTLLMLLLDTDLEQLKDLDK